MAYSMQTDLEEQLSEAELVQLTDHAGTGSDPACVLRPVTADADDAHFAPIADTLESARDSLLSHERHAPDVDGALWADAEEVALGLDPLSRDSDPGGGDGYTDLIELRLQELGLESLDDTATLPPSPPFR